MRHYSTLPTLFFATLIFAHAFPAHAEIELSAYGGGNTNFDSTVKTHQGGVNDSRTVSWDGKPFEAPPYWGVRGTYWPDSWNGWGIAADYTHTKAKANVNFATDPVYDRLEFTNGNNLFMIDALRRFKTAGSRWVPYAGAGVGIAVPHAEVWLDAAPGLRTFRYEYAGPAAQVLAGTKYQITQTWGVFGEGRISYSHLDADLRGGGSTQADIWSPQVALGVTCSF